MPATGIFTISLDFELYWGVRDKRALEAYRENLDGARRAIPRLLECFARTGIHATWATVGFLFFSSKADLLRGLPAALPHYLDRDLSPYAVLAGIGEGEKSDPYHYGASLIEAIRQCPGQEIASHTFSHYYCLEAGQTGTEFRADLDAAQAAARVLGLELRSLVFPRNQCNPDYLPLCLEAGITAYRGNERSWMYAASEGAGQSLAHRVARLIDTYVNLSGQNCHDPRQLPREFPVEIPASRFLRPVSTTLGVLEPLRLRRIKAAMTHAARNGLIYHLWWHPHNFGKNTEANLRFLERILEHYRSLRREHGMRALNMGEIAALIHARAEKPQPGTNI